MTCCNVDVGKILKEYSEEKGNLMEILHKIQNSSKENYICDDCMKKISDYTKLPLNKLYGVTSFYTMFSNKKRGKYVIRMCESCPCHVLGAEAVINSFVDELGIKVGETTKDGKFTLEHCACLGLCAVAPAVMINEDVHGNLKPEMVKDIIAKYE
ncbi:MAG: NADH-quinone oxidoreductase subunit NuoE [Candidatus Muirbacterium halophilum]|nr:NADH-quinone oxidoreductase subunit NuoE [Candidatus Muirbacterium halophilum]MCK9475067.1 NADH-quinone oxidoreductase subunit NuoE [Candidatus Muirbacterium halophilum]